MFYQRLCKMVIQNYPHLHKTHLLRSKRKTTRINKEVHIYTRRGRRSEKVTAVIKIELKEAMKIILK